MTLRLAPVYGPGRGVRERLRKGEFRILDDGQHATSRIHVDDVVDVVFAAEERAPTQLALPRRRRRADDAGRVRALAVRAHGPPAAAVAPDVRARRVARRAPQSRVRNARLKHELGIELRYPSFREGEAAIEAELAAAQG